jgi:aspartyl-tRNA(Asn)/glutamyl-tRNA(Gln) amidotransferase subunit B
MHCMAMIGTSGKALLRHMLGHRTSFMPSKVAEELQLCALPSIASQESPSTVSPPPELESLCAEAILALPEEVEAMRRGRRNVVNKLVGKVMKDSRGRADAIAVKQLLEKMILS